MLTMNPDNAVMSDHSLLRRVREGQPDAATTLYLRYVEHLQALVRRQTSAQLATRLDTEDIVQSVFRTLFRRVVQNHYDVPAGEDLWRLILVLALHKVRNVARYHRSEKRDVQRTISMDQLSSMAEISSSRDEAAVQLLKMVIDEMAAEMPEGSRQIIELRVEGYEVSEIAERTGRAKRSVERVLQQFKEQMRVALYDDES
jgi:RNA polymerase sigma-70 factor, ECF subfamily